MNPTKWTKPKAADIANGTADKGDKNLQLTQEQYEGLYRALQWPEDRKILEQSDRELDAVCRKFGVIGGAA